MGKSRLFTWLTATMCSAVARVLSSACPQDRESSSRHGYCSWALVSAAAASPNWAGALWDMGKSADRTEVISRHWRTSADAEHFYESINLEPDKETPETRIREAGTRQLRRVRSDVRLYAAHDGSVEVRVREVRALSRYYLLSGFKG